MSCNYSVVIRTLGNAGEKYRRMLDAIQRQTVKPKEIIVVIPEGYSLDYRIGSERVVFSEKGMVTQRAVGIACSKSDYLLVLDDDIDFPDDFVEQMYRSMQERQLDCVLAPGNWGGSKQGDQAIQGKEPFQTRMARKLSRWRLAFIGQAFYSKRKSRFYDTVTATGGHCTHVRCEGGLCQTGCFQCFFIKSEVAKAVRFNEESWLEQGALSSYAAYDDTVFFYKCYLQGGRIAYTKLTDYSHLDAAAGRSANDALSAKRIRLYTIARNYVIFWFRHIWPSRRSLVALIGGAYGLVNYTVYNTIVNLSPKKWSAIMALARGYRDGFAYLRNT